MFQQDLNRQIKTLMQISFSHEIYIKELTHQSSLSGEITLKGRTAPTKVYSI